MRLIDADKLWLTTEYTEDGKVHKYYEQFEVDEAPTIESEPVRHGMWIYTGFMEIKCNNCGYVFHELEDINYCPHCGTNMDEGMMRLEDLGRSKS